MCDNQRINTSNCKFTPAQFEIIQFLETENGTMVRDFLIDALQELGSHYGDTGRYDEQRNSTFVLFDLLKLQTKLSDEKLNN